MIIVSPSIAFSILSIKAASPKSLNNPENHSEEKLTLALLVLGYTPDSESPLSTVAYIYTSPMSHYCPYTTDASHHAVHAPELLPLVYIRPLCVLTKICIATSADLLTVSTIPRDAGSFVLLPPLYAKPAGNYLNYCCLC